MFLFLNLCDLKVSLEDLGESQIAGKPCIIHTKCQVATVPSECSEADVKLSTLRVQWVTSQLLGAFQE